jgi:hypothetical protein
MRNATPATHVMCQKTATIRIRAASCATDGANRDGRRPTAAERLLPVDQHERRQKRGD